MPITAGELYRAFDTDPKQAIEFLRWLAEEHQFPEHARVLDVGCGVGRLFRSFVELGWRVTGMEPDVAYRAQAETVSRSLTGAEVRPGGFGQIEATGLYDYVLGINGSFAHMLSPDDRIDAIDRCWTALRPGGLLVLDLPNLIWILRNYREPTEQFRQIGLATVSRTRRHEIDWHNATFTTKEEYRAVGRGTTLLLQKDHVYAITTLPELLFMMRDIGFFDIETYDGFEARQPGPLTGGRMLIVARRENDLPIADA